MTSRRESFEGREVVFNAVLITWKEVSSTGLLGLHNQSKQPSAATIASCNLRGLSLASVDDIGWRGLGILGLEDEGGIG